MGHKKTIYRGDCLKLRGLGQFVDLMRGRFGNIEGVVFLRRGVDTPMHTMRVSEINFPAICRPKTQGISLWCPPWEHFMEIVIKANSKKTQSLAKKSCRQKCLDKSLAIMFPFTPLTAPKNENFKTMKKRLGDIILHKSTKNHDQMLHCS